MSVDTTNGRSADDPGSQQQPDAPPVLELCQVTRTYPSHPPVAALRGVDLQIHAGELVGIVGPSGSGKTTLLQIMGTLDQATTGTVRVSGRDVAGLDDRQLATLRASRIGFVFQQFFLSEHQPLLDNVADGLLYAGHRIGERRRLAQAALSQVGLGDRTHSRANQLSGGQRQRVAIARALVGDPAILLADEPTGNLDSASGAAILGLLTDLHLRGITIVVITHNRELADKLPRCVEILDGLVVGDTGARSIQETS